jgi:hypothetical protein
MASDASQGRKSGLHGVAAVALAVAASFAGGSAAARQVTLPLAQFEELRGRAKVTPEPPAALPAPFTIESDEMEIVVGPASAAVVQRLTLRVLSGEWQTIPLGEAGSLVGADLGGLEGRIESAGGDGGSTLQVRGVGEHRLRLESAVAVAADEAATRPTWRFSLRLPAAAVVRGKVAASQGLAGKVEEAVFEAGGLVEGGRVAGAWSFAAEPGKELRASLLGRAVLPERARLGLRFEATSATSAVLSHTRLKVHAWVQARVAQGRLAELRLRLPEGLAVEGVSGPQVAGWKVADGVLAVTPFASAEDQMAVAVEMSGAPAESFAAPLLVPEGALRTAFLARAVLQGDGLLELADAGSTRPPDAGEVAPLALDAANPVSTAGAQARLYLVADAARPPRWRAAWAERTEVLAAQIDRLWVEVAAGEAGRAVYQVWALVRNRGSADLALALPPGFELQLASRDGVPMPPGVAPDRGLTVPLLTREAPQLVHLAGLIPFTLPGGRGDLSVPLPALSAPAARIEMRLLLPGGRAYVLADPTRAAAVTPPPVAAAAPARPKARDLAAHLQLLPLAAPILDRGAFTQLPAGFVELAAGWSALTASPAPLAVHVAVKKEKEPWF